MKSPETREKCRSRIHIRLYSRLMICNTVIFLIVAYIVAFIGMKYYAEFETLKKLSQSRTALNAVCSYYSLKQTSLADIIIPFYQNEENEFSLDRILRSPTEEDFTDPTNKKRLFDVFQRIADRDGDIKEILIYKNINGSKYVYFRKDRTIEEISGDFPFFGRMAAQDSGRIIVGSQNLGSGNTKYSDTVYGIGGVIGADKDAGVAGKFLVTFNTVALERVVQGFSGVYGRFVIATSSGDVIYDSDGVYDGNRFLYMDQVLSGEDTMMTDGGNSYLQTIEDVKADIIGINIVPKTVFRDTSFSLIIYGIITLMAIICAALYLISGHFISRKVKDLETAMKRVGSNNLSYRIPITRNSDEFGEIALKFNEMCDDLQQTIEREYISEIKKKNAELGSLQAGINPHFLYNTLEVIRIRAIDAGNNDVAKMIVNLANLYRSIVRDRTFIRIRNEINICDMYMDIFSYCYEKTLEYEIHIDPRIMEYGIPKNLLQPIIENYYVHGMKDGGFANHFEIRGSLAERDIIFVFEDNGKGFSKEQMDETCQNIQDVKPDEESGYGLQNIQKRIRLIYGEPYGITIESEENVRTRITVRISAMTCEELNASLSSPEQSA
ncbi:MAG: sensor histidine kinase [Saccharofermentanales bacterium]